MCIRGPKKLQICLPAFCLGTVVPRLSAGVIDDIDDDDDDGGGMPFSSTRRVHMLINIDTMSKSKERPLL